MNADEAMLQFAAESIRGKKDWLNGVLGSVAGGAILGMRSRFVCLFVLDSDCIYV